MKVKFNVLMIICCLLAQQASATNRTAEEEIKELIRSKNFNFSMISDFQAISFYNFEKEKDGRQIVQWSAQGPAWREHVSGGNLIGTCKNAHCKAYDKKVVFGLGYGSFCVAEEGQFKINAQCPICHESIIPKTCAFNRCHFRVFAKRPGSLGRVITDWSTIGNECLLYDESKNTDDYSTLTIKCRPFQEKKPSNEEY